MTKGFLIAAALIAAATFLPVPVKAGPISGACMASDRPGATRSLCGCIQKAANQTLSPADQRKAARLFRDPDEAQQIRASASSDHSSFWDRYEHFGARAQSMCG